MMNKHIPPALVVRTMLVVAALGGGIFSFVRPASQPNPVYAFNLPIQYYGCLQYDMREGEVFGNFEIRQPTQINVSPKGRLHDILIEASHLCECAVSMP